MYDIAVYVGKPKVATAIAVREAFVIKPHQVQQCCMIIVYMHAIFNSRQAEFISGTITESRLDTAAGHPHGESVMVVVSSLLSFTGWSAAKLSTPNHKRVFKHATLFQVG